MRQTLLFGGLESVAYNINRRNADLKMYEFGNCYFFNKNEAAPAPLDQYSENFRLGIFITGLVMNQIGTQQHNNKVFPFKNLCQQPVDKSWSGCF